MVKCFKILNNEMINGFLCIDNETEDVGFFTINNNVLDEILTYALNIPYLVAEVDNNGVIVEEKIGIKDTRYIDVLYQQLKDYEFEEVKNLESNDIEQILTSQRSIYIMK